MRFVILGILTVALCSQLVNCCKQEFCSSGTSHDPELTHTSSASGCEECGDQSGAGGFGGIAITTASSSVSTTSTTSDNSDNPETDLWGSGCDWCNGPGCEDLDTACIEVESGSRSVVCRDPDSEPSSGCFPTVDRVGQHVLCCCEPGVCPGV